MTTNDTATLQQLNEDGLGSFGIVEQHGVSTISNVVVSGSKWGLGSRVLLCTKGARI